MEFTGSRKVEKPLPVRIVLVKPERSMNVGMVARVAKNFSVTDLALVGSKCKIDFEAVKYAKHSREVLDNAKVVSTLSKAVKGFDLVVGTTGVVRRFTSALKTCIALSDLPLLIKGKKVALVFGPEGTGLSRKDFEHCDVVVHIPAEKAHPVLNLSHAVAIVLYALHSADKTKSLYKKADARDLKYLNSLFSQIVDKLKEKTLPELREPAKAKTAFRRILYRGNPAKIEVDALLGVFARIRKSLFQPSK